ncbi:Xanthomonapepsin precursor [Collimonas arenae]|uniref:Xanthomonapepsin n=1 Tax=Collimonas arenae TaxID=279058 RepID=A0A0A1F9V7_9BURK|nr:Xanthomonapepsin precursor [Collimonas arenae]
MTPEQFTKRFAPTEADVGKVVEHLEKSGFINIVVSPNRQLISAEGTAATVQVGFHTTLKNFYLNGVKVFANADAVQVPSALAGIVDAVLGLQNVETAHVQGGALQNTESGEKP